jgi:hypothetical protein
MLGLPFVVRIVRAARSHAVSCGDGGSVTRARLDARMQRERQRTQVIKVDLSADIVADLAQTARGFWLWEFVNAHVATVFDLPYNQPHSLSTAE